MPVAAKNHDQVARERQVQQTRQALDTIDDTSLVDLTHLGIDAVHALKQEVAEIFPASNLPAFLLQGLIQIEGRVLKQERVADDLRVLFRSSKQIGLYGTFLAAPAMVLYGYQRLLTLAGKDIESAFPDGPWQFYTQFGLREDAARHSLESIGFQSALPNASELDAATCWVYSSIRTLFTYTDLLAVEWQEHTLLRAIEATLADRAVELLGRSLARKEPARARMIAERIILLRQEYRLERLVSGWAAVRPYGGPPDAPLDDYAANRRARFRTYIGDALRYLPPSLRDAAERRYAAQRDDLAAYQRQLSLLTTLCADSYQDRRCQLPLYKSYVAFVVGGSYYLIDTCARDA